ncbi:MAG: RluA family pseudouridine synthase [Candidatus Cloacimonetes bacterium]|nr:RluA family pseudouridine synthase [Candidatus Cloacimonadota bacterium]
MIIKILVEEQIPQRIDKYLINLKIEDIYSRSQIERLIGNGLVLVNGSSVKKSYEVQIGDNISIEILPREREILLAEEIPLDIIYEDEYLAVVNKPAGMTVHPAAGNPAGTLVNALLHRYQGTLSSGSASERPGIVHRLDKDTSGLLIVARTDRVHSILGTAFRKHKIKKTYLALCCGRPAEESGRIETYLNRSSQDRKKMAVSESGKLAITNYLIKEYFHYFTLLEVDLETGRTHQIRVHLNTLNCPVLADRVYSSRKRELNMLPRELGRKLEAVLAHYARRQMLHAWKLEFEHPVTGELLQLETELPEDMKKSLEAIRNLEL